MPGVSPDTVPCCGCTGGCPVSVPLVFGVKGPGPVAAAGSARTTVVPDEPMRSTAANPAARASTSTTAPTSRPGVAPAPVSRRVGGASRRVLALRATRGVRSPDRTPGSGGGAATGSSSPAAWTGRTSLVASPGRGGASYGTSFGGGGGSTPGDGRVPTGSALGGAGGGPWRWARRSSALATQSCSATTVGREPARTASRLVSDLQAGSQQ